eukprot:CAMPEP_0197689444 /NCGR_PEP_ID=MMETSP1338-20131121/106848_1 /TAXON_ID=43686 ORGANISM="Pelagodinium beii, Strain RCC1491" /NCGR_SAMPLE_ID=MMETSP1338 /ASSEMBLY_ACC=CAM_ASM_000754 /LENGTH=280 /DNA_ID=CAMNT_0043271777 /DNA_START=1 /DNA_END=843 /DNA_ORIENTATION=-
MDSLMGKMRQAPWSCQLVCIWIQPFVIVIIVQALYQVIAFFPNQTYLYWAENATQCKSHLPDIVLDLHDENEANHLTTISDILPAVGLVATVVLCIITKDIDVWAMFTMSMSFLTFFNAICEASTVIPSSYGYDRCLDYLGIKSAVEYRFSVNLTGSCVAMLWSGHTVNVMLPTYAICTLLGRHYACTWLLQSSKIGPEGRTLFMWLAAAVMSTLLLLNKGHYTMDIEIAILMATLTLTHDTLQAYLTHFFTRQAMNVNGLDKEYELLQSGSTSFLKTAA